MGDDVRRFSVGVLLLAALVLGLLYWSRSEPKARSQPTARTEEIIVPALPGPQRAPAPVKIAAVSKPVPVPPAAARAQAAPANLSRPASPAERVPFPPNLPTAFTEGGFQTELQRVITECKFPYEISEVDCTEFPCIAWGKWKSNNISPDECGSWRETFGSKDFIFFHNGADGLPLAGISIFPPDYTFGGPAVKHLRERANGMVQAQGGEKLFGDPSGSNASDPNSASDSSDSEKPAQKREHTQSQQQAAKAG